MKGGVDPLLPPPSPLRKTRAFVLVDVYWYPYKEERCSCMYEARRRAFMEQMQPGSVAIFRSAPAFELAQGAAIPYQQDSDFYYLTGFPEPEAICVLVPQQSSQQYVLFVQAHDPVEETWTGKRLGVEGAMEQYGADIAYTLDELGEKLPQYLQETATLYYSNGLGQFLDVQLVERFKRYYTSTNPLRAVCDAGPILDELRLVKQADEIALLREATDITAEGHIAAMKAARVGMYEYQLQAELEHVFRRRGALRVSYETIVGSGPNACTMHYVENTRRMEDGDLVLIDAGASYEHYCGDITRTFPVNGRFTHEQRTIYELVLQANKAAIASVKPGRTLEDIHNVTAEIITRGLAALGWLRGDIATLIEEKQYRAFYMHSASHWLGLDTHDRGPYKEKGQWRKLAPGMVLTIEPGVYIAEGFRGVDSRYWNIGVRVEDNVLVTEDGCEVLTARAPKEVAEIEALVGTRAR